MCGITGYIGKKQAYPILVNGLKKLEYRGYDSYGICVLNDKEVFLKKRVGRISNENGDDSHEGNFGIGHCLTPETLIQLADGRIIEISKIKKTDKVLSLNLKTLKLEKEVPLIFKHKSPEYLYEINTGSTSIKATGEHKMFIFYSNKIIEKKVKDIKKSDLLIFPKRIKIKGRSIKFEKVDYKEYYYINDNLSSLIYEKAKNRNLFIKDVCKEIGISKSYFDHIIRNDRSFEKSQLQKVFNYFGFKQKVKLIPKKEFLLQPEESSFELMQIIGYFIGDGHAGKRGLRFKDMRKDVLLEYKRLFKNVFNANSRIGTMSDTKAFLLEINGTSLSNWFKKNVKDQMGYFLDEIGKLSQKELAGFLKGIFDAEGSVGECSGQISITMTNASLIQKIQSFLLRFEILSSFHRQKSSKHGWKNAYTISISNFDSINNFKKIIGFTSKEKQKKIDNILERFNNGRTLQFKYIPLKKEFLFKELKDILKGDERKNLKQDGFITKKKAEQLCKILKNENSISKKFKFFLDGDVVFQEVKEVKKIKTSCRELYDLELSKNHNFIANNLISHNSRWATTGGVCEKNAHPHEYNGFYVVHNGIVENYIELKEELTQKGHEFNSDTDTEVIAHLISEEFKGSLEEAVKKALKRIIGSYGIAVISPKDPDKIVVAKLSSPIIIGLMEDGFIVASDASAVVEYTKKFITLDDGEIAILKKDNYMILKEKEIETIDWENDAINKGEYEHFMLKEIMEEPRIIESAIQGRLLENDVKLGGLENSRERLKKINKIYLIGCGTGYYATKVGEYLIEEIAKLDAEAHIGSEIRYRNPNLYSDQAAIFVSQSGETADNLAALKKMKEAGVLTLGVTNVVGSTQTRETEGGVYTRCGPEIAVASTKAFIGQLTVLTMIAVFLGKQRGLEEKELREIVSALKNLSQKAQAILDKKQEIAEIAKKYSMFKDFWFIGRKQNYPIAMEGALKLKEVSYVHAEGTPGGELKHGPLALIDESCPTIAICPKDSVYDKMLSNIEEVKARGGKVIAIATKGDEKIKELADDVIYIPETLEVLTPILTVIPLHLFAYYFALALGNDIDKPRNLAKSVTVE